MTTTKRHIEHKPLTTEQIQALLGIADQEWQGLILLGLDAGARLLDAVNLRWNNVDMERREVRFVVAKRNQLLVLPMTGDLHGYFGSLTRPENPEAPVFPTCFKIAQEYPGTLAARFRKLQVKADLAPVSFHCLRLTFLHSLRGLGVSENLMAQLMGYSDWKHLPAPSDVKAAAVAKLPRRIR